MSKSKFDEILELMNLKICMITDTYHPSFDGIVRYLDYLIPELIKKGHEVTLVCPHFRGEKHSSSPQPGFTIIRTWTTRFKINVYHFAIPDWRLVRAIRKSDIVILHSLMPLGTFGGLLAKVFRKKVGLFCHHDERVILQDIIHLPKFLVRFLFWLIRKYYTKIVNVFFCATERFRRKLIWFDAPEDRIFRAPFAIDKKSFHPKPETNLRKRHELPKNAVICSYLGRLSVEKNVDNIIRAMDDAMDEIPNLFSMIVGGGPDKEKILNQRRRNEERFIFTGFIPEEELQSHYATSDIFVTPTLNESSCFTVFEAMTCRVPIITSEKDHDPDIVHKDNALLISDVLDHNEIKENILLLAKNEVLRQSIAIKGQELVNNRTWGFHADVFLRGIEETMDEPTRKVRKIWRRSKESTGF
ncbi:MAG: glycosyltransferase family 4 protein [Candidatus Heimdallarchaeota archaeon]